MMFLTQSYQIKGSDTVLGCLSVGKGVFTMMFWLIVADEIVFWLLIILGLACRYFFKKKKLSVLLLTGTPVLDFLLLVFTYFDLRSGSPASFAHVLAAIYIGVSVAFGLGLIRWADRQFAYRFIGGAKPVKRKTFGRARALQERRGWYRHLLAWTIGSGLMAGLHLLADRPEATELFMSSILRWGIILVADFVISFSYTLFPKMESPKDV